MKHPEQHPDFQKLSENLNDYFGGLYHKPGYPKTTMIWGVNTPSEMADDFFDFFPKWDKDEWFDYVKDTIAWAQ